MLLPIQSYERIGNQQELVRQVNDELESRKPYLKQDDSIGLFSSTYAANEDDYMFGASLAMIRHFDLLEAFPKVKSYLNI